MAKRDPKTGKNPIKKGNNKGLVLPNMQSLATHCKFTEEVAQRILDLVEMGISVEAASMQVGLDPSTVYGWRKKQTEPFLSFKKLIDKAMTEKELYLIGKLYKAFETDCVKTAPIIQRALERHMPDKYGGAETVINVQNNHVDLGKLSLDEKKKLLELKRKLLSEDTETVEDSIEIEVVEDEE